MVVRNVEPERARVEVDAELRREADQERKGAVARDRPPGGDDALGQPRLDALPLGRERLLPVVLEEGGEPLEERRGVVEQLRGRAPRGRP